MIDRISQRKSSPSENYDNDPLLNDANLYKALIDNIILVKDKLGRRRDFPFPDDDKKVFLYTHPFYFQSISCKNIHLKESAEF